MINPGFPQLKAKHKAQAFRSERNGAVPPSAVAGIGVMSGVLNRCETKCQVTTKL
jgi:hypothetical protein